jgi:hypothetical protein
MLYSTLLMRKLHDDSDTGWITGRIMEPASPLLSQPPFFAMLCLMMLLSESVFKMLTPGGPLIREIATFVTDHLEVAFQHIFPF